jgi:hydrogenase-4 membrane subunit HyfE
MERALTVGITRIVPFIAGLLAVGHASLIQGDRGRRPFCNAQTTQSIVKDKLPVKAYSFRIRSEVLGSGEGSRFMGSDAA